MVQRMQRLSNCEDSTPYLSTHFLQETPGWSFPQSSRGSGWTITAKRRDDLSIHHNLIVLPDGQKLFPSRMLRLQHAPKHSLATGLHISEYLKTSLQIAALSLHPPCGVNWVTLLGFECNRLRHIIPKPTG